MKELRGNWDHYWAKIEINNIEYHRSIVDHICELVDIRGRRILEIGAGSGVDSIELAKRGAEVIALETSSAAIEIIKGLSKKGEVELEVVKADAHKLPFPDNHFDMVFHQGFMEHFKDPIPFIQEQKRVLADNGYLIIDVPQKFNTYTLYKHFKIWRGNWPLGWETQYSVRELRALLEKNGLKEVMIYTWGVFPSILLPFYSLLRNLHNAGKGKIGKPYLPYSLHNKFEMLWQIVDRYLLQNLGIVGEK